MVVVQPTRRGNAIRLPAIGSIHSSLAAVTSKIARVASADRSLSVASSVATAIVGASGGGRRNLQTVLSDSDVAIDTNDEVGTLSLSRNGKIRDANSSGVSPVVGSSRGHLSSLTDIDIRIGVRRGRRNHNSQLDVVRLTSRNKVVVVAPLALRDRLFIRSRQSQLDIVY